MKLRLIESLGSLEYTPPKDAKKQMADFYAMQQLLSIPYHDPNSKEPPLIGANLKYDKELKFDLQYAYTELIHYLKDYLLKAGFFAIMCEGSGCFGMVSKVVKYQEKYRNNNYNDDDDDYENDDDGYSYRERTRIDKIKPNDVLNKIKKAGIPNKCAKVLSMSRIYQDKNVVLNMCYDEAYRTVVGLRKLFHSTNDWSWFPEYGGKAWINCCDAWLRLYESKSDSDIGIAIDIVYSMQHNTGMFLNKNADFRNPANSNSYDPNWAKQLLDLKFKSNNASELAHFASSYVKQLVSKFVGKSLVDKDTSLEGLDAEEAYMRARYIIGYRWYAAEPIIAKDAKVAIEYANHVIKDRWREAEPYIIKTASPADLVEYARSVVEGRWPEAEPQIMQDPDVAIEYTIVIVKGRWREAEPHIARGHLAERYIRMIGFENFRDGFKEAEPYILKDLVFALEYVRYAIRRPWPELEDKLKEKNSYLYPKYEKIIEQL